MKKLRIAVTADTYAVTTEVINHSKAPFAPRQLIQVLDELGVLPIILPDIRQASGEDWLDLFDGLIIPGGPDVAPVYFGEEPIPANGRTCASRDVFELDLIRAAIKAGKPILGICRGCQIINIALGGNVYQDLAAQKEGDCLQHAQRAWGAEPSHHVQIEPGSSLFQTFGAEAYVNSRHHQAVNRLGDGLRATAISSDGVIEGIEGTAEGVGDQIVAVQWHPENMWPEYEEMKQFFVDFIARTERAVKQSC